MTYKLLENSRNVKDDELKQHLAAVMGILANKYNRVLGMCGLNSEPCGQARPNVPADRQDV